MAKKVSLQNVSAYKVSKINNVEQKNSSQKVSDHRVSDHRVSKRKAWTKQFQPKTFLSYMMCISHFINKWTKQWFLVYCFYDILLSINFTWGSVNFLMSEVPDVRKVHMYEGPHVRMSASPKVHVSEGPDVVGIGI